MDKMDKIMIIFVVVSVALLGANLSFAKSEGVKPAMEPMMDGGGWHPEGDIDVDQGVIAPNCKDQTGFHGCYISKTRYCYSDHLVDPAVCRSQAYGQCFNAYCK